MHGSLILRCRMRSAICIHWDRREEEKKIPYVIRCGTFMDDFSIGSGSIKGEQRAVKALDKWMTKNQHLQIKETTGIIKLLPIEEEKRRRNLPRPGQRGVPMLDMAGYR